ncbi:MAG: hypothetical protein QXH27_02525 [Candidatus Micrarchaeia archaeon]
MGFTKKWKPVKVAPEHAPPSADEVKEMIQKDVARLRKAAKETELMGEDALRRAHRIAEELRMLGYRSLLLRPPANELIMERAVFKAHAEDASYARLNTMLEEEPQLASLPRDDRVFLQAFWLHRLADPALAGAGYEAVQKEFKELVRKTVEKKIPFVITSLDEAGKPCGAAACAYLPKSNSLLIEYIAVEESRKNLGVDSLLITKAIDVANLRALEEGFAGVAAIVAEAEIPSPGGSFKENQARLERMQALVNNGIYPVSGFEYARVPSVEERKREEIAREEAAPKIPAAPVPVIPAGYIPGGVFAPPVQAEEAPAAKPPEKEPVALLLCVRPVNASKEITARQLKAIVRDVHAYYGSRVGRGLFDQLKGKAVIKIMLVDMKKLLSLGKLLGIALPPPSGEGGEGGEEGEEGGKKSS